MVAVRDSIADAPPPLRLIGKSHIAQRMKQSCPKEEILFSNVWSALAKVAVVKSLRLEPLKMQFFGEKDREQGITGFQHSVPMPRRIPIEDDQRPVAPLADIGPVDLAMHQPYRW